MRGNFSGNPGGQVGAGLRWATPLSLAAFILLQAVTNLTALPSVQTLAGGPSQSNSRSYGYANGDNAGTVQFHTPYGLAVDQSGNFLFIADRDNNAVRQMNVGGGVTFTFTTNGISRPVGVALDGAGNVYVLNSGNGTVLRFDSFGDLTTVMASGLVGANGIALDARTNIYVTVGNTVFKISPTGLRTKIVSIVGSATQLQGLTVTESGYLAVCDSGLNGVWLVNPANGTASKLTGFNGIGDHFGPKGYAQFNQPFGISAAGSGLLVVTDFGNNRVKVIDPSGTVTNLYGVNSSFWVTGPGTFPGWYDGAVCPGDLNFNTYGCVEARAPLGIVVAPNGSVYTTEDYYHLVRLTTSTGLPSPGPAGSLPLFSHPMGLALNSLGTGLYIADRGNNAIQLLNLENNNTTTFANATSGINQPVDVTFDTGGNLFVLNQGTGGNGSIQQFDPYGNLLVTIATGLSFPTAFTWDGSGHLFVSEQAGTIERFGGGAPETIATVTNAAVRLQGIALFDDGSVAVSDAGNHVVWQVDAITKNVTRLTGKLGVPGSTLGSAAFAKLNQPQQLARAAGNLLVAADYGNNRLVVVDRLGAITNVLDSTNSLIWFGLSGDPYGTNSARFVPMGLPIGPAVAAGGDVFTSEVQNNVIRKLSGTGLSPAGGGGGGGDGGGDGGGTGTNIVVAPPTITPNSGYFPIGQLITVSSPSSAVYYTTDGSEPTTNSFQVAMSGNVGSIRWTDTLNDLTQLRVKAFTGTNSSVSVSGQPASYNNIGIPPAPTSDGSIYAGIGSSVVVPVVVNLQSNAQIKSYQFRVEIAPNGDSPALVTGLQSLVVSTNDFVSLVTSGQGNRTLSLSGLPYSIGNAKGLAISTVNNGNYSFQNFAVVALLEVSIPASTRLGDSYSLTVSFPSATSDGLNTAVSLIPTTSATILITNLSYTVGDSASASGTWYNAGGFGDNVLANADVNNAFAAAVGLRVPYAFSDAFNALDAFPTDAPGLVGGDGQIRFLDWQVILQRSLGLSTNNWTRQWGTNGHLINAQTSLFQHAAKRASYSKNSLTSPWFRQVLIGGDSIGGLAPGATVNVPLYVTLADNSLLSGLQFRVRVVPQNGAPSLTQTPELVLAQGVAPASLQQNSQSGELALGWSLGSFNFQSRSSNFLGWLRFTIPGPARTGQGYAIGFASADGAPDLNTQYDVETRSAAVVVLGATPPASLCSDEWKLHFFGSLSDARAADMADPDGDGVPNWMEYTAGTDPVDAGSKLRFTSIQNRMVKTEARTTLQWLTAPGKAYAVQSCSNLKEGAWITSQIVSGNGEVASCVETNAPGTVRYYRLEVLPR